MWIPQDVVDDFRVLSPGTSIDELKDMVRRSAPVTHPGGNRRYHDFVFRVSGKKDRVVSVCRYKDHEGCDHCSGRGFTIMNDDFTNEVVKIPCEFCKKF